MHRIKEELTEFSLSVTQVFHIYPEAEAPELLLKRGAPTGMGWGVQGLDPANNLTDHSPLHLPLIWLLFSADSRTRELLLLSPLLGAAFPLSFCSVLSFMFFLALIFGK